MSIEFTSIGDGVHMIAINRPERLNALDTASKSRLGELWRHVQSSNDVRAVVICGEGARAFCAGSDIQEIRDTGESVSTQILAGALPGVGHELTKPVIAVLHGFCIGMGMSLALHCDIRIAHPDTTFAFPEVQHGMLSGITAVTLPGIIGEAHALDIMLTARKFRADEAMRIGVISQIDPDPRQAAIDLARRLASHSTDATQLTKRLILAERRARLAEHFDLIDRARTAVTQSKEYNDVVAGTEGSGRMR